MRGGSYGHYWFKQSKRTSWWSTVEEPSSRDTVLVEAAGTRTAKREDIYFGVHPSKVRKSATDGTKIVDIAAVNCLYADIDAKEFEDDKYQAAEHIKQLNPSPSIIVDSGGGYHCYWLLKEPFILSSTFISEAVQSVQSRWVVYVGGDPAVHDLARILRLPETLNYKYNPPRPVKQVYTNFQRTYTLEELETYLPEAEHRGDEVEFKTPAVASPNRLTLQEIVDHAQASTGRGSVGAGTKFKMLWQGMDEGYESASEADLALCCILAFWTGGDYHKIDVLFRASKRMRMKWDREDYRQDTILKALGQVTEHYHCLLYTSPSPRDATLSRMPSSA